MRTHPVSTKKAGRRKAAKDKTPAVPTPEEEEEKATDAFMTEVESELRDEQMQKFWQSYQGYIYGALAAVVFGVAAFQWWQGQAAEQLAQQADGFALATERLADGDQDAALAMLLTVAEEGGAYAALADLQRAGVLLEQDKRDEALEIYRALSADSTLDYVFTDLAALLWAIHGMESEDPAVLQDVLAPLTDPSNSYSYSALELMALLSMRTGDTGAAIATLDQLIQDANTPASIKARASEMSAVFSSQGGVVRSSLGTSPAPEADTEMDSPDESVVPDTPAEAP